MKLKMLTSLTAIAFAVSLAGFQNASAATSEATAASSAFTVRSVTRSSASITEAQARAAALTHAGLSDSDVTYIYAKLDWDDGRQEYEVEFFSGNIEYEYTINASTGSIISYSRDYQDVNRQNGGQAQRGEIAITEDAARNLALANVPGATAANVRIHLDYDDGRPVYEGTIVYQEIKYDFEISAVDGTIFEWDAESVYDD